MILIGTKKCKKVVTKITTLLCSLKTPGRKIPSLYLFSKGQMALVTLPERRQREQT